VLRTDGTSFQPLGFLPVDDLKQLLTSLAPLMGEVQQDDDEVYELAAGNAKLYLKEHDKWVFVAQTPEALNDMPKDPIKLLEGLDKKYEIALQVHVQNIPEVFRGLAIDQIKEGMADGLDREDGESDADFELRKEMAEQQIKSMTIMVHQTDLVTFGWALDQSARTSCVELDWSAVSGSELAKKINQTDEVASAFGGFLVPDAAVTIGGAAKIAPDDVAQSVATLSAMRTKLLQQIATQENLPDEKTKEALQQIANQVMDVVRDTFQSGKMDGGSALLLGEKKLTFVGGVYVANSAPLDAALRKFAETAVKDPDFPGIKFDADKHGDVRFHTMSVPVPESEKISRVVGNKLDVAIGIAPNSAYLALGADGLTVLKSAIDKSVDATSAKVPPVKVDVSLAKVFDFAEALDDNPSVKMAAQQMAVSSGKDHISFVARPRHDGWNYRLQVEEGVLRLLGKLASGGAGMQAQ
jgi:hypothetical protein